MLAMRLSNISNFDVCGGLQNIEGPFYKVWLRLKKPVMSKTQRQMSLFKTICCLLIMTIASNCLGQGFFKSKSWVGMNLGVVSTRTTVLASTDSLYHPPDRTTYGPSLTLRYGMRMGKYWAAEVFLEANTMRWAMDFRDPYAPPPTGVRVPNGADHSWFWRALGSTALYRRSLSSKLLAIGEAGLNLTDKGFATEGPRVLLPLTYFITVNRMASDESRLALGGRIGLGVEGLVSKRLCLGVHYRALGLIGQRYMYKNNFGLTFDRQGRIENDLITYYTRTKALNHQFSLTARLASRGKRAWQRDGR